MIQSLNYGGMERLLSELVRRFDTGRVESHILALQYLGRFSSGLDGCAVLHVADPMPPYSMLWPASLIRRIRQIAPDVVHTHSGVWYKASLAARRAGVPYLLHTEHGRKWPDPLGDRFWDGLAARRTDLIVAVSEVLGAQLAATVLGRRGRVRIIPNGVDTELYQPRIDNGALRQRLEIPPEVPIIGSIGRLERIKGYDIMLQAFARLSVTWSDGPKPVLVIAGDGAQRADLERIVREERLSDKVRLLGWCDDVHALHEAFTIFTMSSRSEGTSMSLLEAMSTGLCPVVTDVGGNAAVLGPKLRHRLTPSEDSQALAHAWHVALSDTESRARDGITARRIVKSQFSIETTARAYEEISAS